MFTHLSKICTLTCNSPECTHEGKRKKIFLFFLSLFFFVCYASMYLVLVVGVRIAQVCHKPDEVSLEANDGRPAGRVRLRVDEGVEILSRAEDVLTALSDGVNLSQEL